MRKLTTVAAVSAAAAAVGGAATYALMQGPRVPAAVRRISDDRPDVAVVLGIGGLIGAAWESCILAEMVRQGHVDADPQLVIGTSAGGLAAALLRSGLSPDEMDEITVTGSLQAGGACVRLPNPLEDRMPMPHASRARRTVLSHPAAAHRPPHLTAAVAGILPPNGFSLQALADALDELHTARRGTSWPDRATWIPATDLSTGQRTVFGVPGEPVTTLGTAVAASCAVPGLLSPVRVEDHYYVDGGVVSFTHVDLAVLARPRRLIVLNPLAELPVMGASGARGVVGKAVKRVLDRGLTRGLSDAHRSGIDVELVVPTPSEYEAMGRRLMDFDRGELIRQAISVRRDFRCSW